jgi:hypothetical protein
MWWCSMVGYILCERDCVSINVEKWHMTMSIYCMFHTVYYVFEYSTKLSIHMASYSLCYLDLTMLWLCFFKLKDELKKVKKNINTVDPTYLTCRVSRMLSEHSIALPAYIIFYQQSSLWIAVSSMFICLHFNCYFLRVPIVCCVHFMWILIVCVWITRMFLCLIDMLEVPRLCFNLMVDVTNF